MDGLTLLYFGLDGTVHGIDMQNNYQDVYNY
jgi:hypothetical protein